VSTTITLSQSAAQKRAAKLPFYLLAADNAAKFGTVTKPPAVPSQSSAPTFPSSNRNNLFPAVPTYKQPVKPVPKNSVDSASNPEQQSAGGAVAQSAPTVERNSP